MQGEGGRPMQQWGARTWAVGGKRPATQTEGGVGDAQTSGYPSATGRDSNLWPGGLLNEPSAAHGRPTARQRGAGERDGAQRGARRAWRVRTPSDVTSTRTAGCLPAVLVMATVAADRASRSPDLDHAPPPWRQREPSVLRGSGCRGTGGTGHFLWSGSRSGVIPDVRKPIWTMRKSGYRKYPELYTITILVPPCAIKCISLVEISRQYSGSERRDDNRHKQGHGTKLARGKHRRYEPSGGLRCPQHAFFCSFLGEETTGAHAPARRPLLPTPTTMPPRRGPPISFKRHAQTAQCAWRAPPSRSTAAPPRRPARPAGSTGWWPCTPP